MIAAFIFIQSSARHLFQYFKNRQQTNIETESWTSQIQLQILYTDGRREESIIKGDAMMEDGSRILVLSTNQHLEFLARSSEILCDGTFPVCPSLWTQLCIISCKVDDTTSFLESQRQDT